MFHWERQSRQQCLLQNHFYKIWACIGFYHKLPILPSLLSKTTSGNNQTLILPEMKRNQSKYLLMPNVFLNTRKYRNMYDNKTWENKVEWTNLLKNYFPCAIVTLSLFGIECHFDVNIHGLILFLLKTDSLFSFNFFF